MALRWVEGFEIYGPDGTSGATLEPLLLRKWNAIDVTQGGGDGEIETGWGSGLGLLWTYDVGYLQVTLDSQSTWTIGFAYKAPTAIGDTSYLLYLKNGATEELKLRRNGSDLQLIRGSSTVIGTATGVISATAWHYIELQVVIGQAPNGSWEIRINETTEASASSVDTQNLSATTDSFTFNADNNGTVLDDIYICDDSGSLNTTFLGAVKIEAIYPDGDDTSQWTPDSGTTNYTQVDETPPDDDTSYVEADTLNEKDLYTYDNLSVPSGNIRGAMVVSDVRLDAAGAETLITVCKSGTTESDDGGISVSDTSYGSVTRILELDPDTSSQWTVSGINAALFGIKMGS